MDKKLPELRPTNRLQGRKRWVAAALLVAAGASTLAIVLITRSAEEANVETEEKDPPADAVWTFRQPEQQERFVDAVTRGKQKAIATLEMALAEANLRGDADQRYVADLEQRIAAAKGALAETRRLYDQ